MPRKIIIDADPGYDDAIALALAILSPEIELLGLTTVRGNGRVEVCTENALRVLDYLGADVPVYEGMAQAMLRPEMRNGISLPAGTYLDLPPARSHKQPGHAVDWLIGTLLASDGDITLMPIAPLTNIATAIRLAPDILPKIRELVIMGGAHAASNMTPAAEYNIWIDPEAAKLVLGCGRPIRLITLDATTQTRFSADEVARIGRSGAPAAVMAAGMLSSEIALYGPIAAHDALALCAIIDPAVVRTRFVHVDVETRGELTDGRTVCDLNNLTKAGPNVHVALEADKSKYLDMLVAILSRHAGKAVDPQPASDNQATGDARPRGA
jgi:inosine-uridine nucleoside N-ribohydrolase